MSSSDTGPRKRFKDKKRKKGSIGELSFSSQPQLEKARKKFVVNETIHVQNDVHVGGNILSKLVFVSVLLLLGVSLMYVLGQNGTREEADGSSITSWITNVLNKNYNIWSGEKEQPGDDIEPEEISGYNYWDYFFPFVSFIQRTYNEPEDLEKDVENEAREREPENTSTDDETSDDRTPEDGTDSEEKDNDEDDRDDEEEAPSSGSPSSYKYDTYEYDSEEERSKQSDDGKDESSEEDDDENEKYDEESERDTDSREDDDDPNDSEEREEETDDSLLNEDDDDESAAKDDHEATSDFVNEDPEREMDEPDREASEDDNAEPSHAITKLGVGVALIFVAYTVIIRKWNNYVVEEQVTDVPEAEHVSEQHSSSSQDYADRSVNRTLQDYLETPSASESEDELAYSPDLPDETFAPEEEYSESYTGSSGSEDGVDSDIEPSATFDRYASGYPNANITNEYDWRYKEDLDDADGDFDRGKLDDALAKFETILRSRPNSVRAKYGVARVLDRKAEALRSNKVLSEAINAYEEVLNAADVPNSLFKSAAERVNNRMWFKGEYGRAIRIQKMLIERFPDDVSHRNNLVVTLLTLNRMSEAETLLEEILHRWPHNGSALVHYGFTLKQRGDLSRAVDFLRKGIDTREPVTQDGRFYYHLGDALRKLKRDAEAMRVYEEGAAQGVFLSKYQRSLYNVDRLTARPWWSLTQSTYASFFRKLEASWLTIRDEAVKLLNSGKSSVFREEAEQLREMGDWKQFELFSRGAKNSQCDKAPFTCRIIQDFHPAAGCRRGQVKFSIMEAGTHVWPHCGPTNCRLRAHLGLIVPPNVSIRVANETRTWKEGEVLIFDDSFEHEVWHNGTTQRLVLIVDVWHPELTERERKTLSAI